jgi:hypothetical protein
MDSKTANDTRLFAHIVERIISQQESIIGPIAVERAKLVKKLNLDDWSKHSVSVSGDPSAAIDELVERYKELFGQIAVETCKEAVSNLISQLPAEEQPKSLR